MQDIVSQFNTRQEAAAALRVSVSTVDRWIKNGTLRAARFGSRVVISDDAITEFCRAAESGGMAS
jgi:excisionase family DNA binding protein